MEATGRQVRVQWADETGLSSLREASGLEVAAGRLGFVEHGSPWKRWARACCARAGTADSDPPQPAAHSSNGGGYEQAGGSVARLGAAVMLALVAARRVAFAPRALLPASTRCTRWKIDRPATAGGGCQRLIRAARWHSSSGGGSPSDCYARLGVPRDASAGAIRHAFLEKAKASHPDLNPGQESAASFTSVQQAWAVLRDGEARRNYDITHHGKAQPDEVYSSPGGAAEEEAPVVARKRAPRRTGRRRQNRVRRAAGEWCDGPRAPVPFC